MSRTIPASSSLNRHDTSLRFALSIFNRAIFSTTDLCQYVVANTPPLQLSSNSLARLYSLFLFLLLLLLTFCPTNLLFERKRNFSTTTIRSLRIESTANWYNFSSFRKQVFLFTCGKSKDKFYPFTSEQVSSNWEFLFLNSSFDNLGVFSSHFRAPILRVLSSWRETFQRNNSKKADRIIPRIFRRVSFLNFSFPPLSIYLLKL